MKITDKFRRQSKVYKLFAEYENLDFSDEALKELFEYESNGIGDCDIENQHYRYLKINKKINGYAIGKRNLNITVSMWLKNIDCGWGNLITDIYCSKFPKWWIGSIFREFLKEKGKFYTEFLNKPFHVKAQIKLAKYKRKELQYDS